MGHDVPVDITLNLIMIIVIVACTDHMMLATPHVSSRELKAGGRNEPVRTRARETTRAHRDAL